MLLELSTKFAKELKDILKNLDKHDIKVETIEDHDIIWIYSDTDDFCMKHHINLYSIYIQMINFYNSLSDEDKDKMYKEFVERVNEILSTNYRKVDLSNTVYYLDPKSKIRVRKFVMKLFLYK